MGHGSGARGWLRPLRRWVISHVAPDALVVRRQYRYRNGFAPDLAAPKDLSEKVLWLKLHDRSPLHTLCADKIRARDYAAARAGADLLVPLQLVSYDPDDVRPEAIPAARFVLKTNHDQGGVFICHDRARFDWRAVRDDVRRRMRINKYYEFREEQYKAIRPGLIVEDLVEGADGAALVEIKVNCCTGRPTFIEVVVDRFGDRRVAFHHLDWSPMALRGRGRAPPLERALPPPPGLDALLKRATRLAAPFLFCRVDFLAADDRLFFNELTFHPAAGLVRYQPAELERALGDAIDLSRHAEFRRRQAQALRELATTVPRPRTRIAAASGVKVRASDNEWWAMHVSRLSKFWSDASRAVRKRLKRHLYPDALYVMRQYHFRNGFYPSLRDPKELSEKVQWLKLHDRSPLHTICADKICARDYVAARIGPEWLAEAYLVSHDPNDVAPEKIGAPRFVIKTNHDQGGVFICKDRAAFDWTGVREKVAARMAINKYPEFREYQYKHIRPGFIAEQLLEAEDGGAVREMKFYCFHGRPGFIQVVLDRFENRREIFYDPEWRRMRFEGPAPQLEGELPRAPLLDVLLEKAAILAAPFLFCRIDFLYDGDLRAWFGEVTFHHGAGLIRFQPLEFERRFGDMIDLSRLEETKRIQRQVLRELAAAPRAG